jgi:uncharacterized protein (DUF433 family)
MSVAHEAVVYVTSTPSVCGGKPCIAGTRVSVQLVVLHSEAGDSPDDIVRAYPHVTLAQVHGALAYYYDHVTEINDSIARSQRAVATLRSKTGPSPLESLMSRERGDAAISS